MISLNFDELQLVQGGQWQRRDVPETFYERNRFACGAVKTGLVLVGGVIGGIVSGPFGPIGAFVGGSIMGGLVEGAC